MTRPSHGLFVALISAASFRSADVHAQHRRHHHDHASEEHSSAEPPAVAPEASPPPASTTASTPSAPAPTVSTPLSPAEPSPTPHTAPRTERPTIVETPAMIVPPRPVALDLAIGIRAVSRHLSFHQDLGAQFQPYDLWVAPAAAAAFEWFPGAHFTRGFLAHIGVYAQGDYVFGVSSQDHSGNTYDTLAYSYAAGLRLRIPLPLGASEIGIHAGYLGQTFTNRPLSTSTATTFIALSVAYDALRAGLSLRLTLGPRISLLASGGYLYVVSAGDNVAGYFPRATTAAVDASAGVALALPAGFEVRGMIEGRRYFYAMNPMLGDPYIVGGALDQYVGGSVLIAWRH